MNKLKAFTLVEVLLALAIVGVIATVTANQLRKMQADKIAISFQNCYNSMSSAIKNMYEDEVNYPKISTGIYDSEGNMKLVGFANFNGYTTVDGQIGFDGLKFAQLFADEIGAEYVISSDLSKFGMIFSAKNGSDWLVQVPKPALSEESSYIVIIFDTNGKQEGPNCPMQLQFVDDTSVPGINCAKPDRFRFYVSANGKITPDTAKIYNNEDLETYIQDNHLLDVDK